jgi:hypothetical protein
MGDNKMLSVSKIHETSATQYYELGETFVVPATSSNPEAVYKYIQYHVGTGTVTCTSHDLLVIHGGVSAATLAKLAVYTADKSDYVPYTARYCGVSMGAFTATNKYGFIQIKGRTFLAAGTTNQQKHNPLTVTAAGSDKEAQTLKSVITGHSGWTNTSVDFQATADCFATQINAPAAASSSYYIDLWGH